MKKIKLNPCPICNKNPNLLRVKNEYKYFCGVHCSVGNWKHTKNAARRDWNIRSLEGDM